MCSQYSDQPSGRVKKSPLLSQVTKASPLQQHKRLSAHSEENPSKHLRLSYTPTLSEEYIRFGPTQAPGFYNKVYPIPSANSRNASIYQAVPFPMPHLTPIFLSVSSANQLNKENQSTETKSINSNVQSSRKSKCKRDEQFKLSYIQRKSLRIIKTIIPNSFQTDIPEDSCFTFKCDNSKEALHQLFEICNSGLNIKDESTLNKINETFKLLWNNEISSSNTTSDTKFETFSSTANISKTITKKVITTTTTTTTTIVTKRSPYLKMTISQMSQFWLVHHRAFICDPREINHKCDIDSEGISFARYVLLCPNLDSNHINRCNAELEIFFDKKLFEFYIGRNNDAVHTDDINTGISKCDTELSETGDFRDNQRLANSDSTLIPSKNEKSSTASLPARPMDESLREVTHGAPSRIVDNSSFISNNLTLHQSIDIGTVSNNLKIKKEKAPNPNFKETIFAKSLEIGPKPTNCPVAENFDIDLSEVKSLYQSTPIKPTLKLSTTGIPIELDLFVEEPIVNWLEPIGSNRKKEDKDPFREHANIA